MRTIQAEGLFPLSLDALWELLHAHVDEGRLHEIHPWILSGRSIREAGSVEFHGLSFPREKVAERVIRIGLRPSTSTWTYRIEPPVRYGYDVALPNGSTMRFDNAYSSLSRGTVVKTRGEVSLRGVPSFLASWLVRRSFQRSDREDLAYANKLSQSIGRPR